MDSQEVGSQVVNQWNRLPAEVVETPTFAVFERGLDTILKGHEFKFNFKSDCSPIVNQLSEPITITWLLQMIGHISLGPRLLHLYLKFDSYIRIRDLNLILLSYETV